MILRIIKFLLICIIGTGCTVSKNDTIHFKAKSCTQLTAPIRVIKLDSIHPRYFFPKGDSLILLTDFEGRHTLAYVMDVPSNKILSSFYNYGRKKNQVLSVFTSGMVDNHLWVYDIVASRLTTYNMKSSVTTPDSLRYRQYSIDKFYYWMSMGDSVTCYAVGNFKQKNKIDVFKLDSKDSLPGYGNFSDIPDRLKSAQSEWRQSQQGFLYMSPDNQHAAIAGRFTDKLEFFDLNNRKSTVVRGPDTYDAQYTIMINQSDTSLVYTNQTKRAYTGGFATKDYLFTIYQGDYQYKTEKELIKRIFVFDWQGNYKKCYNLDGIIKGIAVSADSKEIYIYTAKNEIHVFKL
jgi:hypothetical protein